VITHLFQQGPAIGGTLRLLTAGKGKGTPELPGAWLTQTVGPRSPALVADYLRVVGGDPKAWAGRLPPHMFPQWGWALITRTLHGLPYDLTKVVNAGCSWRATAPLFADQPLALQARLLSIDDDGCRALIVVELKTGTAELPDALVSTLTVFCPLPAPKDREKVARDKPTVPANARALGERRLPANQGWRFALVTGDFNPIHWVGPYAKLAGFGGVILHGFGTAAVAAELLIKSRLAGDVNGLLGIDARFTRPLRLPATATVFTTDGKTDQGAHPLYVGTAPGGPAFLVGGFHV